MKFGFSIIGMIIFALPMFINNSRSFPDSILPGLDSLFCGKYGKAAYVQKLLKDSDSAGSFSSFLLFICSVMDT